jgi:hypothetical protein
VRQVDEVLVILPQSFDDLLVPLELPAVVLHWIEYKDALGDVNILVCCEPIGEDRIRGIAVSLLENFDSDTLLCQDLLESVKFLLSLYS